MDNLVELFCIVDDFCKEFMPEFEKRLLNATSKIRRTNCSMSMSEIMTIVIHFHQSHYRDFKLDDRHFLTCHAAARYDRESVPLSLGISLWAICLFEGLNGMICSMESLS